jgi:hypothetical protein
LNASARPFAGGVVRWWTIVEVCEAKLLAKSGHSTVVAGLPGAEPSYSSYSTGTTLGLKYRNRNLSG